MMEKEIIKEIPVDLIEIPIVRCVMCGEVAEYLAEETKEPLCDYCMEIDQEIMRNKSN